MRDEDRKEHERRWVKRGVFERVTVVETGYEWICPHCNYRNKEVERNLVVMCRDCDLLYLAEFPRTRM